MNIENSTVDSYVEILAQVHVACARTPGARETVNPSALGAEDTQFNSEAPDSAMGVRFSRTHGHLMSGARG